MIVDTFAGPGGWDEGLALLGRSDVVGLEWDAAACKTAKTAGHARIRCDVTTYPTDAFGRVEGLIGSPSCTLFSAAGNGVGNLVTHILAAGIVRMMHGDDCRVEIREAIYPTTLAMREAANTKRKPEKRWTQERVESQAKDDTFVACLVLEPARYILALGVEWVALEQVPEVLPLWRVYVRELKALGYSAWTGVLNSADYGVPQTRQRAILMASRTRNVQPPEPTHAEHPHDGADLFGAELKGWVSMATALGWNNDDRLIHPRGVGMTERHGPRDDRVGSEPAMPVTSKGRSWERFISAGVTGQGRPKDPQTQPADTLTGKGTAYWTTQRPAPTITTTRRSKDGMLIGRQLPPGEGENVGGKNWIRLGNQAKSAVRNIEEPAPTVLFGARSNKVEWFHTRPATTVVGSFCPDVISAPGYRTQVSRQNAEGGVRVTVAEGGVLQSFPASYPWQGSRTKQYQQVGNAIPPRLAMHILAALGVAHIESERAA